MIFRLRWATAVRALILLGLLAAVRPEPVAYAGGPIDSGALRDALTVDGIRAHQRAFADIAAASGGSRAGGTPGYDASVEYVAGLLTDAGYEVTMQPFTYPFFSEVAAPEFERVSPDARTYEVERDFLTMEHSGSGDVSAPVQAVDLVLPPSPTPSSTSGCETSDFAGFTDGAVALIQRGACPLATKAANAEAAGASAVLIFNEGQPGRIDAFAGTLGEPGVTVPVLATSFAVGEELAGLATGGETVVRAATQTRSETRSTVNVIAGTASGQTDRTVVVGAHLDGVPEGPGINDNGSGSATILEIALQMARLGIQPRNHVRFAFWGAEEPGLHGSAYYVSQLTADEIEDIAVNLNFDMLGSPNYVRFVYDGDGSATPPAGPAGSGDVEQVFLDYFAAQGLAAEPTPFDGRSDYDPFIAVGIPAGGLASGAEEIKTAEQAAVYGGTAGQALDPCYHLACDDVDNFSAAALDELGDAAAHAVLTFAQMT